MNRLELDLVLATDVPTDGIREVLQPDTLRLDRDGRPWAVWVAPADIDDRVDGEPFERAFNALAVRVGELPAKLDALGASHVRLALEVVLYVDEESHAWERFVLVPREWIGRLAAWGGTVEFYVY